MARYAQNPHHIFFTILCSLKRILKKEKANVKGKDNRVGFTESRLWLASTALGCYTSGRP